ncbi:MULTISPECIES: DUF1080 domain-containing protein [unclassified Mucilaginibacter]|uniref:3-keto-disaccharide hydrolase n=1 Tax=unclassified Mucilaginibacter TaxID=2617802 RepID=UPI002AC8B16C|nr:MULTISPECIES: DUF1080 domain-containing protein [unclassified Mucilaginibacter]MEB0260684.1 DUF1080 domain-containing protein [Mucilaginibacter sp. 10I4]MEB0277431.1 DUF1080 domain-containing protein [Mucilaginibacter sp. 10B2]MEB0300944.1 DUF1080 domain-containing protein [Mucilaginibacter sp. 5C4]WPX24939.1 DUF1080 domain-containing protein [Mucilaginibacter sp. 5C4]
MKHKQISYQIITTLLSVVILNACSSNKEQHNILSNQEKSRGWALLFDGKTLNGWHIFNKGNTRSAWSVDSGQLICNPHTKNVKHGDLVTDNEYENYELQFDWKISKAGNSGLFINVQERPELGATFATGPEYQLLDDKNIDADYLKDFSHKAAAIFGVLPNISKSVPNPGEWNHSRIVQKYGKITFWLNGVQTITTDFKSDAWKKTVAASSMSKYPDFAIISKGHIAVQDWTSGVAFRDIKIKVL